MIAATGATGQRGLDRLVIDRRLSGGTPASGIVALARNPDKAQDLAGRGAQVRAADYSRADTRPAIFAGAERPPLGSDSEVARRDVLAAALQS